MKHSRSIDPSTSFPPAASPSTARGIKSHASVEEWEVNDAELVVVPSRPRLETGIIERTTGDHNLL